MDGVATGEQDEQAIAEYIESIKARYGLKTTGDPSNSPETRFEAQSESADELQTELAYEATIDENQPAESSVQEAESSVDPEGAFERVLELERGLDLELQAEETGSDHDSCDDENATEPEAIEHETLEESDSNLKTAEAEYETPDALDEVQSDQSDVDEAYGDTGEEELQSTDEEYETQHSELEEQSQYSDENDDEHDAAVADDSEYLADEVDEESLEEAVESDESGLNYEDQVAEAVTVANEDRVTADSTNAPANSEGADAQDQIQVAEAAPTEADQLAASAEPGLGEVNQLESKPAPVDKGERLVQESYFKLLRATAAMILALLLFVGSLSQGLAAFAVGTVAMILGLWYSVVSWRAIGDLSDAEC